MNRTSTRRTVVGLFTAFVQFVMLIGLTLLPLRQAQAVSVDLVVNIVSDQPAYLAFDLEHFTVTISNNGPGNATNVALSVLHPVADIPFEASATCQAMPGPNPNGSATCPPGSGTAGSGAFTRTGQTLNVTIPSIPSQSQVKVEFDNRARCPPRVGPGGGQGECFGAPHGNYTVTASVTASEIDVFPSTNTATTNIFLYPPNVEYKVVITSAPASAAPGSIAIYEFEVQSTGDQPSDKLQLRVLIKGQTGTMTPLSTTNNPNGLNGSSLPNTQLLAIDCLSTTTFPSSVGLSVFPASPQPWQACPTAGLIPIPIPTSGTNSPPVTGFPSADFLDNLPGIVDAGPPGGVMKFRARVLVGDPLCVGPNDITNSGNQNRDLEFSFNVTGQSETRPGATSTDNTMMIRTAVPGVCTQADIQFTTGQVTTSGPPNPPVALVAGSANWTYFATVTNASSGSSAGTAMNVPVAFEHHQFAFTETQGPLTCTATGGAACPNPLPSGTANSNGASYNTIIPSLPPGGSVKFEQVVTDTRTACWWQGTSAQVNLSGNAGPSLLFDPFYSTTPTRPTDFTAATYFVNNGQQSVVTITGLTQCTGGGGGSPPGIAIVKSGPFASATAANAGAPLIGQNSGSYLPDGMQVFYKIVLTNTNSTVPLLLGDVNDTNYFLSPANTVPASGFVHSGTSLASWGISCVATLGQTCHEMATTSIPSGYNRQFKLAYDPTLHGGNSKVALAPNATLTYIVPFTTATHTNKCQPIAQVSNNVSTAYVDAVGFVANVSSSVNQFIGMPVCVPGILAVNKGILLPATATSIPLNGLVSYDVTLTNTSTTATLDIPHFVDKPTTFFPNSVNIAVVSITCTTLSGGAKCPTTPVVPGIKTTAGGVTSPLPNPFELDHEWGVVGNNTFPPNSSIKFTITLGLTNPTRDFRGLGNNALFSGENDQLGWTPASTAVNIQLPPAPELSLQKRASPQIAMPGSVVTYTVIITNIGTASANGSVFTDPLPASLLGTNPGGYINVTCSDISTSSFVPSPRGLAVCPSISSTAAGLNATIATFGPNTALQFTYQALMPATTVTVDNQASVSARSSGGISFGPGTAQSHQNVQVIATPAIPAVVLPVPSLSDVILILLAAMLALLALVRIRRRLAGSIA